MKAYIFVQARMNSKRLPGKVLIKIKKVPVLQLVVNNLKKVKFKKKIIILCSNQKKDDKIFKYCEINKIKCFRGSLNNVYKRYLDALNKYKCKSFIRISADSPLIDSKIVDLIYNKYKKLKNYDIVTNCLIRTFPKGLSVEMINSSTFSDNYKNVKKSKHKEHITSYFYDNKKKFKIFNLTTKKKYKLKKYALDNHNDLIKIKKYLNEKN